MSGAVRFLLLVSMFAASGGLPVRAADEFRVMQFNVRYGTASDGANHWDRRKDFLLETIRAFDPDLLGTQEALSFQRDFLSAGLAGYAAWGAGRDDGKEQGEMTLLYYRTNRFEKLAGGFFWLSEAPDRPGSRSWDSALPRMVAWVRLRDRQALQAAPVLFLNTHFDHRGEEARLKSAELIRDRVRLLRGDGPVILTGDFNADEGSGPYRLLFEPVGTEPACLRDAFRVAHPVRGAGEGTFSGFRADAVAGPRIDWIGISPQWTVTECLIDRTDRKGHTPSDHFPVCARLTRPQP